MLFYIWTFSIVIGISALAIMVVLVVLRIFHERRHARDEVLRRNLTTALIRFSGDGDRQALMAVLEGTPAAIMADSGFEFLSLLRGDERRRIEEVFGDTDLPDFVRRRLRKGNEAERIHSAEVLTSFPGAGSVDTLLQALGDRSREVRIAAAISLNALDTLPPLQTVLERIGPRGQRSRRLIDLFEGLPANRSDELLTFCAENGWLALCQGSSNRSALAYRQLPFPARGRRSGPRPIAGSSGGRPSCAWPIRASGSIGNRACQLGKCRLGGAQRGGGCGRPHRHR